MTEIRRYSLAAVVLLVVLRLAIGWQLLYEGLWKIDTLHTTSPWTSAGYLRNAVGPMRNVFRNMAGDPDELGWLDYEKVSSRWQDWSDGFQKHHNLSKGQAGSLYRLLHGSQTKLGEQKVFAQPLAKLPLEGKELESFNKRKSAIWFDAKAKQLYINADKLLQPDEKAVLESLVKGREDADAAAYRKALNTVYERQKNGLGYLRKLAGAVKGNPELRGDEKWQRLGKLDQYKQQLAAYEKDYAAAKTDFQWDHVQHTWGEIQSLRAELTGPVKAMEAEFKDKAEGLLTTQQLSSRGAVPEPWTLIRFADTMTIIGLTALGSMLMLGLFTRFAAIAAAFMLFSFYLAMPPLPGVPEIPGPEHSFIVNKNLIEVFALLAIAALPTGIWFGLDRLLGLFIANWKQDKKVSPSLHSTVAAGDEPSDAPEMATAT